MTPLHYIILAAAILTVYVVGITIRFGWLPSLSESFYKLDKWESYGWLFTVTLMGVSFLLLLATLSPLIFFAMAGIWWVACAAEFKDNITSTVHYLSAVIGFAFAMLYLWLIGFWISVAIAAILCVIIWFAFPKIRILLIELALFGTLIISLIINFK